MMPISVTVQGQGTSKPFIPDIFQNPFQIGIGCVIGTGNATYSVEHCFEFATVMSPTWNGTTGVNWMQNSGINNTTSVTTNGNYAFAVAAIRLNVLSTSNATVTVTMNLLQSSNAP